MKLNAAQLEAFSTLAKVLHFTKAAEALHITQSALSQRIAKLEEELETTLFIRDKSSVRLTEAAHQVLRYCQLSGAAETELLENLRDSQEGLSGTLSLAGFSSVNRSLLIPALQRIVRANPKLSVKLMTREIWELKDLLERAEVDYILTSQKSEALDVESLLLGWEENVLVRSKKFGATGIFCDHDERDPTTKSFFRQNKMAQEPKRMRYLDDVYGLIDGVKNGFGEAILPRHLIQGEKDLEIVDGKKVLKVPVYLQFYRQAFYRRAHATVLHDLRTYFGKILPGFGTLKA